MILWFLIRLICLFVDKEQYHCVGIADEHPVISASLLEMFGARSSVSVNQQIFAENNGVILWQMEVCLCFCLLALTLPQWK